MSLDIASILKMGRVLVTLEDYEVNEALPDRNTNLFFTALAVFVGLWIVEYTARFIYGFFSGPIFEPKKHRVVLGRHTMDVLSMVVFSYFGFEALLGAPFNGWESIHSMHIGGKLQAVGLARAMIFSASAQRLCVWQVAYEAKNFCDSVIHNDGAIFLAHHLVTGLLSTLATRPFLHIYCAYFLGISEVSTSILCVLVLFDADRGIPPLAAACPVLMKLVGVAFAVTFIIFRVVLWPWVCYYFWVDMLEMLKTGTVHSEVVAYIFMVVNAGLTILQFVWLGEIISTAVKLFGAEGGDGLSIKRGKESSQSETDDNNKAPIKAKESKKSK